METQATDPFAILKTDLANGEYRTLVEILSNGAGRLLGQKHISIWKGSAIICALILVVGTGLAFLLGERQVLSGKPLLIQIVGVILAYNSFVIFQFYTRKLFDFIAKHLIDCFLTPEGLQSLVQWLKVYCNVRLHTLFCLIYGLTMGVYSANTLTTVYHVPSSIGLTVLTCLVVFAWGIPMYWLLVFLLLPFCLNKADYHIFKADPASSAIVVHVASIFTGLVYLYGVVAMGSMFYLAYADLLTPTTWIVSIAVAWLPIILLFIAGQWLSRNIIARAKFLSLSEVQKEIESVQQGASIADKETMEKVYRLLDYHDRIKGSKSKDLYLRASLDFLNSLLLPVAGAIVGNIETFLQSIPAVGEFFKSLFP